MLASMTFWEWAGTAVLLGLSGGSAVVLLKWLRETLDRKARKISYHAKALLEQADLICGTARAMLAASKDRLGFRRQASVLWANSSTSSYLNVWLANAWVLDQRRKRRPLRSAFESAVERLREAAVQWHEADMKWREAKGIIEGEHITGGEQDESPEAADKAAAAAGVAKAFEAFLEEFQALHNVLEPLVREYTSPADGAASEAQQ